MDWWVLIYVHQLVINNIFSPTHFTLWFQNKALVEKMAFINLISKSKN